MCISRSGDAEALDELTLKLDLCISSPRGESALVGAISPSELTLKLDLRDSFRRDETGLEPSERHCGCSLTLKLDLRDSSRRDETGLEPGQPGLEPTERPRRRSSVVAPVTQPTAPSSKALQLSAISSALRDQAWGPQDIGGHLSYELL